MTDRALPSFGPIPGTATAASGAGSRARAGPGADGVAIFAPVWAMAVLFSLAAEPAPLVTLRPLPFALASWAAILVALAQMLRPRALLPLVLLAALMALRYALLMPVASNNATIATLMHLAILAVIGPALIAGRVDRDLLHARLRVVGRGLLAVMYVYGIFHKINADFLDPEVSCASALYAPIAGAFGLGDSLHGKHLAIAATFAVEAFALVALYWPRYFALGMLVGLPFHYIIPISGYAWYMDFSSLVLALYLLSAPPEVGARLYATAARPVRWLRRHLGPRFASDAPALLLVLGLAVVALATALVAAFQPARPPALYYVSAWYILWALTGGIAMLVLASAALDHLPWRGARGPRQPLWLYAFPALLFAMGLSPYIGLKTESAIAMFSNLHTEGGTTNHLLFATPPYLFDYQRAVAWPTASSNAELQALADRGEGIVLFQLHRVLERHPNAWVSYRLGDGSVERATLATIDPPPRATWIERNFLVFKPVDDARPKRCTH